MGSCAALGNLFESIDAVGFRCSNLIIYDENIPMIIYSFRNRDVRIMIKVSSCRYNSKPARAYRCAIIIKIDYKMLLQQPSFKQNKQNIIQQLKTNHRENILAVLLILQIFILVNQISGFHNYYCILACPRLLNQELIKMSNMS